MNIAEHVTGSYVYLTVSLLFLPRSWSRGADVANSVNPAGRLFTEQELSTSVICDLCCVWGTGGESQTKDIQTK